MSYEFTTNKVGKVTLKHFRGTYGNNFTIHAARANHL